jgi:hypothetical protein
MGDYGGKSLPSGYKARYFTDHENFVVCHIHRVEKVVKNGSGRVKHFKLSDQPVAVGVSLVNHDAGDYYDVVNGNQMPGIGKHIALQRAIEAMPQPTSGYTITYGFGNSTSTALMAGDK